MRYHIWVEYRIKKQSTFGWILNECHRCFNLKLLSFFLVVFMKCIHVIEICSESLHDFTYAAISLWKLYASHRNLLES